MNHPGELKRLAELARPEVGVVTNVGESHLEFLGSVERVLAAKGELLESLEPDGTAVINADDPHLMSGRLRIRARTLTFGIDRPADVRAVDVEPVGEGGARFTLAGRRVALGVFGREFVYDALAAAAAAHALGIPLEDAGPAIEGFRPFRMRMEVIRAGGVTVINDAYNANPLSVRAALDTLGRLGARGRTVAVLGDMLELGAETRRLHQEVGRHAARSGVGRLLTVGAAAREIGSGALAAGMAHRNSRHFEGSGEVREALRRMVEAGEIADGDVVLVKASRGLKMETVVEDLVEVLRGRE
jgi:UDP-N-acetylmuramoyl-tripeptide--D-alanyl-D-alanine ligase